MVSNKEMLWMPTYDEVSFVGRPERLKYRFDAC